MILLFETCDYDLNTLNCELSAKIKEYEHCNDKGIANIKHVGHLTTYINGKIENIFFLPKIFMFKPEGDSETNTRIPFGKKQFANTTPIILSKKDVRSLEKDDKWESGLFYKLPLWIYSSLVKYQQEINNSSIVQQESINEIISSKRNDKEQTLLDIVISLIEFLEQNRSLFIFIYKEAKSGYNKVNWNKTVSSQYPIIDGDNLVYPLVNNQRKGINYDEDLMVIFFSTLRYINSVYGIDVDFESYYNLPSEKEFTRQTDNGTIAKHLKRIRNNYYNDRLMLLWNLLNMFHSKISDARKGNLKDEFLMCSAFDRLFERMVDSLASDNLTKAEQNQLKDQKDGKTIDHLLKGISLTDNTKTIYYVGDSKYYPDGDSPHNSALYKQFTYVRNIIQTQFDWYYEIIKGSKKDITPISYRDNVTDGYDITPNFFIGGKVRPEYSFDNHCLTREKVYSNTSKGEDFITSKQFDNRLFDRDTLFILQYSLNLFYLLKAYSTKTPTMRNTFREFLKCKVRKDLLETLNSVYDFYYIKPKNDNTSVQDMLSKHFYYLCGKVFCIDISENKLILALEKEETIQYSTRDKRTTIEQIINENFEKETFILQG